MAISEILLGKYHIWDILGLGLKSKPFCRKKKLNDEYHGNHSAKTGAVSSTKNTPSTSKFIRSILPVWDIGEGRIYRASIVRA